MQDRTDAPHHGGLLPSGKAPKDNSIIPYLAKDVIFTLDQLAALNQRGPTAAQTSTD